MGEKRIMCGACGGYSSDPDWHARAYQHDFVPTDTFVIVEQPDA